MAGNRIGQRVGPFELAERLEADGSTTLYRAVRPAGSREPRVVCIRLAEDPRDERAAAWVRHEYDTLRALSEPSHPTIPRPYGYYASQVAVAMEDRAPVSLADALRLRADGRVPLDAATAVDILVELAQSLRHAHSTTGPQGPVLHGHVSPAQIVLRADGSLRVVGYGRPTSRRVPSYTAPEQAAGAFMDARTDQWALGSLGVEMLLGQAVYSGAPDPMGLALQGRVGPWLDRLERRWPEVCRVLARCLAPAAGDRYAREADLVRDLLAAARTIGGRADIAALAGRVAALLPAPAPVQPRRSGPIIEPPVPLVHQPSEPPVDPTLVPLEDDVDPESVRGAALRPPPDRSPEPDDDDPTANDPIWQSVGDASMPPSTPEWRSEEDWRRASALPPSLAASSHPAARKARAALYEEARRPAVERSSPPVEPLSETPAASSIPDPVPHATPETEPPAADLPDERTVGEPAPAPPRSPEPSPDDVETVREPPPDAPQEPPHDPPQETPDGEPTTAHAAGQPDAGEPTAAEPPHADVTDTLGPTQETPAIQPAPLSLDLRADDDPAFDVTDPSIAPTDEDDLGAASDGEPSSVAVTAEADDEEELDLLVDTLATVPPDLPGDGIEIPRGVVASPDLEITEGLRWTEVLAVIMVAALVVTGASFLIGLFS